MAQDFANGARRKSSRTGSRTGSLRTEPRRVARRRESVFHWGSFGAGITVGVALTLAGALLPEWWTGRATTTPSPPAVAGDPTPVTRFEFFERLPNESTAPRSVTHAAIDAPDRDGPREFLLQAGSFTNKDDAERLRAILAQSGWNTETAAVTLSNGVIRHRVIVGPFATSQDTQRAIAALRKQDVEALVLARKPAG
jgi:SPOR domain